MTLEKVTVLERMIVLSDISLHTSNHRPPSATQNALPYGGGPVTNGACPLLSATPAKQPGSSSSSSMLNDSVWNLLMSNWSFFVFICGIRPKTHPLSCAYWFQYHWEVIKVRSCHSAVQITGTMVWLMTNHRNSVHVFFCRYAFDSKSWSCCCSSW